MVSTYIDEVDPSMKVDAALYKELLLGLLDRRMPRFRDVIYRLYWLEQDHHDVAKHYNLSRTRIKQIENKALQMLKRDFERQENGTNEIIEREVWLKNREMNRNEEREKKAIANAHKKLGKKIFNEQRKAEEAKRDAERVKRLEAQAEEERELPCPDYMLLVRVDGEYALEIPIEELEGFVPVTKPTYDRWLKEKIEETLSAKT